MGYIPYDFVQKSSGIFIEPQQAKVVQQIYQRYLVGIADFLFQEGISSPQGKERWTRPVISSLLSNKKYVRYIISLDDFSAAQIEKGKRSNINIDEYTGKRKAARYSSQNVLSGLLVCSECGASYRRITRPTGEVVWRCANRVEHGKRICKHSPSLSEISLKGELCKLLKMDLFDELKATDTIDLIFIQENGALEVDYKKQEFSPPVVWGM